MTVSPKRHPELTVSQYDGIVQWCQDAIDENKDFLYDVTLFDQAMHDASVRYQIQPTSLNSLLRNTHVWHVKITTRHVKAALSSSKQNPAVVHDYSHKGKSLWQIAKSLRYPPYLVARNMLEVLTTIPRKGLTDAMRDPVAKLGTTVLLLRPEYIASESSFEGPLQYAAETRLAREVLHVLAMDPMYGPTHDAARHTIGVKYERLLEELLDKIGKAGKKMLVYMYLKREPCFILSSHIIYYEIRSTVLHTGIPYETEEQLRQKGTARTPDVLLSTPCAVKMKDDTDDDWRIICWIDSKVRTCDRAIPIEQHLLFAFFEKCIFYLLITPVTHASFFSSPPIIFIRHCLVMLIHTRILLFPKQNPTFIDLVPVCCSIGLVTHHTRQSQPAMI